ncbi:MAG: hypothetical protein COB77_05360 [Gammaproteobacteria bacterium]|nr:MAG: hypothetical protein COB77_05360 [Gammaproteobacteria bacterium]
MSDSNPKESRTRSVLKAFSWRIIATTTTIVIAYAITGETETAIAIGSIEFFSKFIIYYIHERIWQRAPQGAIRKVFAFKK